jgi:hypothetical protein
MYLRVIEKMHQSENSQKQNDCLTASEENKTLWSKKTAAQPTMDGKYHCRYCGLIFNTLEEHDIHHRQVHGQHSEYLTTENQS